MKTYGLEYEDLEACPCPLRRSKLIINKDLGFVNCVYFINSYREQVCKGLGACCIDEIIH